MTSFAAREWLHLVEQVDLQNAEARDPHWPEFRTRLLKPGQEILQAVRR